MHHTRATHNAHNETQRRYKKAHKVIVVWNKRPIIHSQTIGKWKFWVFRKSLPDDTYFTQHRGSVKWFKKYTHKRLRRRKIDVTKYNRKLMQRISDPW